MPRYRVLFNTLLANEKGVEEGLVQRDSPFCGTKRFGMCLVTGQGSLEAVGTTLEIMEFGSAADGRLFVTSKVEFSGCGLKAGFRAGAGDLKYTANMHSAMTLRRLR